jgi:hypothetical protein
MGSVPLGELVARLDGADPVDALKAARDLRDLLPALEAGYARAALAAGETWESIGAALGVSRQAAWSRLREEIARAIEADRSELQAKRDAVRHAEKIGKMRSRP